MTTTNGYALHDELERTAQRWPTASTATVQNWVRGKIGEVAAAQSRRVLAEARCILLNRALVRFVELVYDGADAGVWYNVSATGRIETAAPWSRTRHTAYGLNDPDSRVLRTHLIDVVSHLPSRRSLFAYFPNERGGYWHLNRGGFPTLAVALEWVNGPGLLVPARYITLQAGIPRRGHGGGR